MNKSDFRIFCYSSVDSDIRSLCFVLVFLKTFGCLLRWFSVFVLALNLWRRRGGSTTLRTASKRLNTCDSHQLLHLKKHRQQRKQRKSSCLQTSGKLYFLFPPDCSHLCQPTSPVSWSFRCPVLFSVLSLLPCLVLSG